MTYSLYLDDERNPTTNRNWVVCRTVNEAKQTFEYLGWPSYVSFDHDLGFHQPTGMAFARFLVDIDSDVGGMPDDFDFNVHSANPAGRDNIQGLVSGWMNAKKRYGSVKK